MYIKTAIVLVLVNIYGNDASECGCKTLRTCYKTMLETLTDRDETACIEDTTIGTSTVLIFLKALNQFCPEIIKVIPNHMTYEGRHLYEVVVDKNKTKGAENKKAARADDDKPESEKSEKPVIIIDAGQQGGSESVGFALYVIEQLVACEEYEAMAENVRWVFMPSTNPDGQEYSRYSPSPWKKNLKPTEDQFSFGVDISRNFDSQWASCHRSESSFSATYPGPKPVSENETIFINEVISKHKNNAKIYISIRRDGHALLYPYGYSQTHPTAIELLTKVAAEVTIRVNQRAGGVHLFVNESIFENEGKEHCGNSVDYALDTGIPLSYEMRVFLGSDNRIMSKFQSLPRGYETTLRNGYFSAIREFYNVVTNEKKYGKIR